ncbi:hypothetical protein NX773_18155 [Massilia solisilvae]|uniref:Uncharacterized protein n=1 Tax=Massilia solisilvae TaxID=1811225 RepID=A0ABT2BNJ8_9BURK|nr:hypothetical protein [Massilia solisilvae]MCS0610093.1 hypothetical protein [Massilia solisilvae]
MANKALATRQKMRLLAKPGVPSALGKPRNPFAGFAKNRSAGPHVKTESAQRSAAKRALKKVKLVPDEE